jgi:hypothetical protein
MARYRPMLHAEDAKALTLLMSPAADEFAIALAAAAAHARLPRHQPPSA